MIRIILNDLWLDVKKNFLTFILYFVVYGVIATLGIQITLIQFLRDLQSSGQDYSAAILNAMETSPTIQAAAVSITAVATILFLWLVLRKMPIRLSMPLYVCAAGEKEKMHYLRLHLIVKVCLSLVLAILVQLFMSGRFFLADSWMEIVVQLGIWFFLILALNLRTDPGNKKEALESVPDMVTEKSAEVVAGVYWFALLIIESIVFYTLAVTKITWNLWIFLVWMVLFAVNILIAVKCSSPILAYMLSYEKMYYPLPDKKE